MPVLRNIGYLATCKPEGKQEDLHEITHAALVWQQDKIVWVGKEEALPASYQKEPVVDAQGCMVIPGLIDCHTHLAFGGWRADEFALRARGVSYLEIARQGGGILKTVRQTRQASEEALLQRSKQFLQAMSRLGVTYAEAKSGYGLTVSDELKLLRVYQRINQVAAPLGVVATFLGAHVVPPEYQRDRTGYIRLLCEEMIPAIAEQKLAQFCDVFVEEGAFSAEEAFHILETGKRYGLQPKLHVDQLHDGGGAELAASVGAISADHLEYTSEQGIEALAKAGVVAVALPLASLYLRQQPMQARAFIEAGVPVAVATDFNPGSAPSYHLPLALTLACVMNGLTPAEALKGATCVAAQAIGKADKMGVLAPGKEANFVLVEAPDVNHWLYHFRPNAVKQTYIRGQVV